MPLHIKLTKIDGEKSHETSLQAGQSIKGIIEEGSMFPQKPTIGRPFAISGYEGYKDYQGYRTSRVTEILEEKVDKGKFKTHNSTYKWEWI